MLNRVKFQENIAAVTNGFVWQFKPLAERMQNREWVQGEIGMLRTFIWWAEIYTETERIIPEGDEVDWYLAMDDYVEAIAHFIAGRDELPCYAELQRFATHAIQNNLGPVHIARLEASS